ncbi:MAG: helix-turn-helix transcriptional regulator [Bacillota bacterium]
MSRNSNKALRIISIYERLNRGELLKRKKLAKKYAVSPKTITRDINDLNTYLSSFYKYNEDKLIKYSQSQGGYLLENTGDNFLTSQEILGITKVLLESRAFNESEMNKILDKLIHKTTPASRKQLEERISNERFHYTPVRHNQNLLDIIWEISQAILKQKVVNIKYNKPGKTELISRKIDPLGIMFSEFYFYLIAHNHKSNDDFKIVYRLDRICKLEISDMNFQLNYTNRFQEGEFRKKVQFMTAGELMTVKFKFRGILEAVLDRLPTARILEENNGEYILEAEVYGPGIKMWFLSQGERLEVISPQSFREKMKSTIKKMLKSYKN